MASLPKDQWRRAGDLYESGLPMRAVAERMNVPIGAITYVLRALAVPRRSHHEARRIAFFSKKPSFSMRKASRRSPELEAIGAMLYWAEGYKTESAGSVDFANSNPAMVELFIRFLRDRYVLDESRLRCFLYCYENQNVRELAAFWSELLRIPPKQFTKPYVRRNPKAGARVMPHGLIHVRYSDKKLLLDIVNLIESYRSKYCAGGRVVNYTSL